MTRYLDDASHAIPRQMPVQRAFFSYVHPRTLRRFGKSYLSRRTYTAPNGTERTSTQPPVSLLFHLYCVGRVSCMELYRSASLMREKSKDSCVPVEIWRTDLSKALWGRCARYFGPRKLMPMWQRFAAAIREMPAAICRAKSRSPQFCFQPSTSDLPNVRKRRAF